jgi:anti-anti-sigma regulatory factor
VAGVGPWPGVAPDVTALVAHPARLDAAARYEHRVDHLMARLPLSAMCAYNQTVLGADVLAQLATMHPLATESAALFRLYASSTPGCAAAIGGELDLLSADLLDLALERAELRPVDGELVLDAAELMFIDQARLAALVEHAQRLDAPLVLRSDQPLLRRLVRSLGWKNVGIEAAP